MMDCAEFQSIVAGEREDDLSAAESRAFEEHLEACGACREGVARAEEDLDRLAAAIEPPLLPTTAWASVDAAVAAAVRPQVPSRAPLLVLPRVVAETPAAPVAAPVVAAPVAAAPAVAQPRFALARGRRARSSGFALAFAAAGIALVFSFMTLGGSHDRAPTGIGRVKPPEEDDVQVVKVEPGAGHRDASDKYSAFIIFR